MDMVHAWVTLFLSQEILKPISCKHFRDTTFTQSVTLMLADLNQALGYKSNKNRPYFKSKKDLALEGDFEFLSDFDFNGINVVVSVMAWIDNPWFDFKTLNVIEFSEGKVISAKSKLKDITKVAVLIQDVLMPLLIDGKYLYKMDRTYG